MKSPWWLAILLLIVILVVGVSWLQREPARHEAKLSNGTVVRFEKVGKGQISYDSYSPLQVVMSKSLPARFQGYLGERYQGTLTAQENSLGILVSLWTPEGKRITDADGRIFSRVEITDSSGFTFVDQISGYSSTSNIVMMDMDAFPRRDRRWKLRCYERDSDRLLFEIDCSNPFYSDSFETWQPQPTPNTQQAEPLSVTLKRDLPEMTPRYPSESDLDIESTDPRWTRSQVNWYWWLTDATGNKAYSFDRLSPFERAWKLSFLIRRKPQAEFGSDEVWRTERFSIPTDLESQPLNLRRIVAGVELVLTAISSRGILENEGGKLNVKPWASEQTGTSFSSSSRNGKIYTEIYSGLPFIQLLRPPLDTDTELVLTVRDQTGTVISLENRGWYSSNGQTFSIIQFQPTPESTEIDFEVIVNRGRTFEFLVAPPKPASSP